MSSSSNSVSSVDTASSSNSRSSKEILEKYWQNGLRGYGTKATKKKLLDACQESGLTAKQVKVWINNRRRGQNTRASTFKLRKRNASGYVLFRKKYMEGKKGYSNSERGNIFRGAAQAWQNMSAVEKQKFNLEGQAINKGKPIDQLSAEELMHMRQVVVRDLKKLHEKAKLFKLEFLSIYIDRESGAVTEEFSECGKKFSEANSIAEKFANFVVGTASNHQCTGKVDRSLLQQRLQELLNERASLNGGTFSAAKSSCEEETIKCATLEGDSLGVTKVPYKRIQNGEVSVSGMPDGVTFKRPSMYGISTLEKLIEQSSGIIFQEAGNNLGGSDQESSSNIERI